MGRGSSKIGGARAGGSRKVEIHIAGEKATAIIPITYTGTAQEVKQADDIITTLSTQMLAKQRTYAVTFGHILQNDFLAASARKQVPNADDWVKKIKDAGYSHDLEGAMRYLFENSTLYQDVSKAKKASQIISKYNALYQKARAKPKTRHVTKIK